MNMKKVKNVVLLIALILTTACDERSAIAVGQPGSDGQNGEQGVVGPQGEKGEQGLQGLRGLPGLNGRNGDTLTVTRVDGGVKIASSNGTSAILKDGSQGVQGEQGSIGLTGRQGEQGEKGHDGIDGENNVTYSNIKVLANSCTKIADNLWVENIIRKDKVGFDVYFNENCRDAEGEHCDNVIPAFGNSGNVDFENHPGSGTVCPVGEDRRVTGTRLNNAGDLVVHLEEFVVE